MKGPLVFTPRELALFAELEMQAAAAAAAAANDANSPTNSHGSGRSSLYDGRATTASGTADAASTDGSLGVSSYAAAVLSPRTTSSASAS
eukprot:CAMPEP_0181059760 /NCGR_PEP_ID=MMETSP1070-20121207/21567_1 /TAXON_ID=265543 /ORGANISM="Minutocellus polymorphus, Strain NH13" /LENGTH=89 /DNA_ID=CAMNT_0023139485 /DNA_START=93 /DNA_END=359 /DNA_ORIENTATION=-